MTRCAVVSENYASIQGNNGILVLSPCGRANLGPRGSGVACEPHYRDPAERQAEHETSAYRHKHRSLCGTAVGGRTKRSDPPSDSSLLFIQGLIATLITPSRRS